MSLPVPPVSPVAVSTKLSTNTLVNTRRAGLGVVLTLAPALRGTPKLRPSPAGGQYLEIEYVIAGLHPEVQEGDNLIEVDPYTGITRPAATVRWVDFQPIGIKTTVVNTARSVS